MIQFLQQRFRLLQILRIKPFSEPVVDLGQQLVSFGFLALLLPKTGKTRSGTKFLRLGLLTLRNLYGLEKTGFRFGLVFSRAS
jgi:hypothetical protein